jgi:putative tryptophan/tyrosine transport system substrate-binding protein
VKLSLGRLVALALGILAVPLAAHAQQPEKTYRVAYLAAGPRSVNQALLSWFEQGMRDLGYVEGRNLVLERRFAEGKLERLPVLAQELIRLNPDVIFVSTTPGSLAAKAATPTIPIVFVAVADPVGNGLVPSLAGPSRNVTGITHIVAELTGKRLELLKEIMPSATRIAVLVNPDDQNATAQIQNAEAAARALGFNFGPYSRCEAPPISNARSRRSPGLAPRLRSGWSTPPWGRSAQGRWNSRSGTACP